jgi:hypothetical protein
MNSDSDHGRLRGIARSMAQPAFKTASGGLYAVTSQNATKFASRASVVDVFVTGRIEGVRIG